MSFVSVFCLYVEKKPAFAAEAASALADLKEALRIEGLSGLRIINRYLIEGISPEEFENCRNGILSDNSVDEAYEDLPDFGGARFFATESLPGQFDQRADSLALCVSVVTGKERPAVRCAKIRVFEGNISDSDFARIKNYLINPVEIREIGLSLPTSLATHYPEPEDVPVVEGFTALDDSGLDNLREKLGLAMDFADIAFCRDYFREQGRDPSLTEMRMIDAYWSDHCRHTTFLTRIEELEVEPEYIRESLSRYHELREETKNQKPVTLMDMATIGMRTLKKRGRLNRLDVSEEINACCVNVRVDVDDNPEDWLVMFKNETHNHPTEIEPFGGANTCLGGAIRDVLSGRGYVYQAMRITGAANPLADVAATRPGKLPQRVICRTAAEGYSAYGNQIGVAAGLLDEIYHPGYEAKRMELGAVVGAAPAAHVFRASPEEGDRIILLGDKTGRDGCGAATGSSKAQTSQALETSGAEVQKGNAPEERKLLRLFRNREAALMIRRCNDFGAGGVSVAIGELAPGIHINLDAVPVKYPGLSGTELAISESQERMAVVVSEKDVARFTALADAENLQATVVARVTREPRLVMEWRGKTIVNLRREFLDLNGAPKYTKVRIPAPAAQTEESLPVNRKTLFEKMGSLDFCSRKGIGERFDSTACGLSVLLPNGGKYQLTPAQVMAAKLPLEKGETSACSIMGWAYNPLRSSYSPYHGGIEAVVESVAKVIAAGGFRSKCWLSFQEFYEKLGDDPVKWGGPAAALLGALDAQMQLELASVGGKDSMSGSFEELKVPPALFSFALGVGDAGRVVSSEFKNPGSTVYLLAPSHNKAGIINFDELRFVFDTVEQLTAQKRLLASWAVGAGGTAEGIFKMCLGNHLGFSAAKPLSWEYQPGAVIIEAKEPISELESFILGSVTGKYALELGGENIDMNELQAVWEATLRPVYPDVIIQPGQADAFSWEKKPASPAVRAGARLERPLVAVPVFPGTNCEYETIKAFEKAGARCETFIMRDLFAGALAESEEAFAALLARCNILAIPGGAAAGDEPDGAGKLIAAFLRKEKIREQIENLIQNRDGLILGAGNGFQALVRLGLLPFGEYRETAAGSPALARNIIGRHQSRMIRARVASNKSPWLGGMKVGDIYCAPVSGAECRFAADEAFIRQLAENGQIATQYADIDGKPSMDIRYNPGGSDFAIEGITSPDGRIFGKMAHDERCGESLYLNFPAHETLDIFRCGVGYYTNR